MIKESILEQLVCFTDEEIDHLNGVLFIDNMIPGTLEYISPEDNK